LVRAFSGRRRALCLSKHLFALLEVVMAYFGQQDQDRGGQGRGVLLVALVALVAVALALCGGTYFLYQSGAFDTLLSREPAAEAEITQVAAGSTPPEPTTPAEPTARLIVTATPGTYATRPLPTREPTQALAPTATPFPSLTPSPTLTEPADPLAGKYLVEYLGCKAHGSSVGTVKGRVLDRQGNIVVGAEIRVTLNGWPYDTPARSNEAGWYEFYLDKGLKVKIASLRIHGQEVPLAGHEDQEFKSQAGCFEHVNLRQQ